MKRLTFLFLLSQFYMQAQMENVKSTLEIFDITTNDREVVYESNDHFEAPNWSRDGKYLLINSKGKLYNFYLKTKVRTLLNTGFADKINNDHGISPDGKELVISHHDVENTDFDQEFMSSRIYILPIEGGAPKEVTTKTPSFWHGWSPDGQRLAYVALRDGEFDIYTIDKNGGEEKRITSDKGLDDGPDYSPDGKCIYYNGMKSGKMEIWRMKTDGSKQEQLTDDAYSNWFPHPSPDGKYFVYLAYLEDQGDRHPPMKKVALRLYDLKKNTIRTLCEFTGGQGTINVPSWSPDSKKFAFVSYKQL